jgi:sialic acid synthase SpsE
MNDAFAIGDRYFDNTGCLVVAEIGTGHGGDVGKAHELIAAAATAGADCAKFQCVIADEILHPATGTVPLPGGPVPLYKRFQELELDEDFYAELKAETEAQGMIFLCTPFGIGSARLLKRIGVRSMKVASPELNHFPLLDELASYKLPTILSSGVSTLADIERAIGRFRSPLALLHCVTAYPAPEEEYNLRVLQGLSLLLGLPVGVSDHSLDSILIPALAVAVGGVIVEKHICLSRADTGLDDPVALTPEAFGAMVRAVRLAQSRPPADTIEDLASVYGRAKVEAALGDGVKRLAPSEEANYLRSNRSVHAVRAIGKGEILGEDNIALLRTEKVLRTGLAPELFDIVLGRRARRDVPAGEGIEWEDVGDLA